MTVGLTHFIMLSAILFCIGLFGALAKSNAIAVLMCIEIMLNGVNVALVAFSRYIVPPALTVQLTGQVFAIFVMTVAAAEAAVGLAIIISIYRRRGTVDVEQINLMRW